MSSKMKSVRAFLVVICISLMFVSPACAVDIVYRAHCADIGWTRWVRDGAVAGTTGQSRRMEAIQIRLVPRSSVYD